MRQRILLVLVVIIAIVPLATGHPWRPAVGASSVLPGVALADIPIGAPIGEVLARFGSPSVVRLTGGNGLLGYGFDRYGITVYAHGDLVQAVATTNSVLGGVNGIALGAPLNDVVHSFGQVYSQGTVEGYPGIVYGAAGVAFGIDHEAVAAILVFRPAGAMPAQPASPDAPAGPITSQNDQSSPVFGSVIPGVTVPGVLPAAAGRPASTPAAPDAQTATADAAAPPAAVAPPAAASVTVTAVDVSRLKSFTAGARYMSLAGYVRYLVHDASKTWMTPEDADRLMRQAQRLTLP